MIKVDLKGVRKLQKELETLKKQAVPHAIRNSLNRSAFAARKVWQGEIKQNFTLRNQFTTRSIRVEQARGLDTRRMMSVVGSVAPYLATQEESGRLTGKSGSKPIPGPSAAGQPPGTKRTRLVRRGFKLASINVAKARPGMGRRHRNAMSIAIAKKKGIRFVLLGRRKGGQGLFLLSGGRKKVRTRLLWDLSRKSVFIPRTPTLEPAIKRLMPRLTAIHEGAFKQQLKRHRILGY